MHLFYKVARVYNKIEEDFSSCAAYDDYLEEIENIVYNMTHDINRPEEESKLDTYEKHHKEEIKKNYLRKSAVDEELDRIIEEEKIQSLQRMQEQRKEMEKSKQKYNNRNESLLKVITTVFNNGFITNDYHQLFEFPIPMNIYNSLVIFNFMFLK